MNSSISSSEGVRTLIAKLLLLLVPTITAVYGFPFVVLAVSGELMPVSSVVRRQARSDALVLYGPSYSNPVKVLKTSALLSRKPAVAVLGTSRVMQFRSQMFRPSDRFYNAGGAVATVWELRPLLQIIPISHQPQILIIGLDQNLFNANYAEFRAATPAVETAWKDIVQNARSTVYDDYKDGKFTLTALFYRARGTERLGLNAVVNNNGFRNDGSYYYGKYIVNPRDPANDDVDFKNTLQRISEGASRFEYGRHVSHDAVTELEAFLRMCHARGIHVVAYLPPYAHEVFTRMISLGDKYGYIRELPSVLMPVFESLGYTLFDFSDLLSVGASDVETIDGFHPSERAYVRMLLTMQRMDPILRHHVADSRILEETLDAASPYVVFRDEF